jgi:hypothetical protein
VIASAVVLVDYDNVRPANPEHNADFLESNLIKVIDQICLSSIRLCDGSIRELVVRLYGGWTSSDGRFTRRGDLLVRRVSSLRGIRHGIRILPEAALSLKQRPSHVLRGLYRLRAGKHEQKMVDTMICVDLIYFMRHVKTAVIVASDDDDLVPALAVAREDSAHPLYLLRHRDPGTGVNDDLLRTSRVNIDVLPCLLRRV